MFPNPLSPNVVINIPSSRRLSSDVVINIGCKPVSNPHGAELVNNPVVAASPFSFSNVQGVSSGINNSVASLQATNPFASPASAAFGALYNGSFGSGRAPTVPAPAFGWLSSNPFVSSSPPLPFAASASSQTSLTPAFSGGGGRGSEAQKGFGFDLALLRSPIQH